MVDSNLVDTLAVYKEKLLIDSTVTKVDVSIYKSIIGLIMFLSNTGLDLMYVVGVLSRFMHSPY
jgi:hypothetical protein